MSCLFVDHLTVIDCAYLDAARGLVGESWIVDLELEGELDAQSMVLDFGEVKRRIKRAIDHGPDHTLILPLHDPRLSLSGAEAPHLTYESARGLIEHRSPACAITGLPVAAVTAEAVAAHLQTLLRSVVPDTVARIGLRLRTETIDGAWYHYTHGLKKHDGQCQRIAHGHRSAVQIVINGQRHADWEARIAAQWRDVYLGTRSDLIAQTDDRYHFAYDAPEGRFELALPRACCDLLDTDTTVERIADHLFVLLTTTGLAVEPRTIEVRAFEGVNKGARVRQPHD